MRRCRLWSLMRRALGIALDCGSRVCISFTRCFLFHSFSDPRVLLRVQAWLAIKETSLLLGTLAARLPLEGPDAMLTAAHLHQVCSR
jgi:hypothetical protein